MLGLDFDQIPILHESHRLTEEEEVEEDRMEDRKVNTPALYFGRGGGWGVERGRSSDRARMEKGE